MLMLIECMIIGCCTWSLEVTHQIIRQCIITIKFLYFICIIFRLNKNETPTYVNLLFIKTCSRDKMSSYFMVILWMMTQVWRMSITMPLSHCLHNFWIMPKNNCSMQNHHSTSFWVLSCWVANYFFFFLFNSWSICTKIGYIGWYYWLAISTQSSSCSDVHSPQS
jgi:hypothetical protein